MSEADTLLGSIRLGPFVLEEPIGRGGMGAVWRGRHLDQGVPVAVKILDTQVTEEELEDSFKNEVRAVAKLDHPGVVWVYDVGQIDQAAADSSGGRIAAECPYIAMEWAGRGTLRDWGLLPWEGVREVLLALLDALAHAHARGVIHQDLKPANVLVSGPEDLRPGLKLADFGIAHAIERRELQATGQKTALGTVQYMAPEQIRAESWDCGPWTDIYSLGNVAWQMLTGQVPFQQYQGVALVRAQLEEMLPDAGIRAPEGFRAWLRRCLAKDPRARFLRAADAAEALLELDDHVAPGPKRADDQLDRLPTIRVQLSGGFRTASLDDDSLDDISPKTGLPVGLQLATSLVTLPSMIGRQGNPELAGLTPVRRDVADWRRPESPRRSLQLLGAGLKLWGVRRSPMVGRVDERDQMWEALRGVVQHGGASAVVITGAAGTGKTRLGSWLCERANELGVATAMRTRFFDNDRDGLRRMWTRQLRMGEVSSGGRGKWLAKTLDRLGIGGRIEEYAVLVGPGKPERRHDKSESMLRALTNERPVVVMLDDVHVGLDGLILARQLLEAEPTFPVLIVLTARVDGLVDNPNERRALEAIIASPHTHHLQVKPLPPRDHVTLVEEVLGLAPALAAQVVERTGGNPSFVLALIGDWIRRGILELGPTGFEVKRGVVASLPSDMKTAWMPRVDRVLDGLDERSESLLERAAVLGLCVDTREWALACDDPDGQWLAAGHERVLPDHVRVREALVDRLVLGRLAERTEVGFDFAHGMLREAILARASSRTAHHAAVAAILPYVGDQEAAAERIGWHLLQSGQFDLAVAPLLRGIVHRRDTAGPRSALGLLANAEQALQKLDWPEADPRWAEVLQLRAMLCAELGEVAEAERAAGIVVERASWPGWDVLALDAQLTLARLQTARGALGAADALLESIAARATDPVQQGLALAERALIAARRKDPTGARAHTDRAIRLLRSGASSRALAECWRVVGTTALYARNERQAEDALGRALRLYQRRGNLIGQAECLAGLGRAAMMRQDQALAEERLREAIHAYELAGNSDIVRPKASLARLRIEQGRYDEARDLLANLRLQIARQGGVGIVEGLGAMQLAAAAGCLDWEDFEHRIALVVGDMATEVGEEGRFALDVAAELAEAVGDTARVGRLKALADDLRTGRV